MIREPWFWRETSLSARLTAGALSPLGNAYQLGAKLRAALAKPYLPPIPLICIGNANLGGSGKTPFAIMLAELLRAEEFNPCFLSRGYGGAERGPVKVDEKRHSYIDVGDEALLLAQHAETFVAKNRRAGAESAAASGADVIIMDDGFQNPTVAKDAAILLVPLPKAKNQYVFPAGPWREPLAEASARADLVISIAHDKPSPGKAARLTAWTDAKKLAAPEPVLAFSGIANPQRFIISLQQAGYNVRDHVAFPDHHPFTRREIEALQRAAKKSGAQLITTEKDLVRIAPEQRNEFLTLPIEMRICDPAPLLDVIRKKIIQRSGVSNAR